MESVAQQYIEGADRRRTMQQPRRQEHVHRAQDSVAEASLPPPSPVESPGTGATQSQTCCAYHCSGTSTAGVYTLHMN